MIISNIDILILTTLFFLFFYRDVKTLIVEMLQAAKASSSSAEWMSCSRKGRLCPCKWNKDVLFDEFFLI